MDLSFQSAAEEEAVAETLAVRTELVALSFTACKFHTLPAGVYQLRCLRRLNFTMNKMRVRCCETALRSFTFQCMRHE
jgi:hypothetical protein